MIHQRIKIEIRALIPCRFTVGGYIAGDALCVDAIRSFSPGFIFSTAMPPAAAAGALASVRHLKSSNAERLGQQASVSAARQRLVAAGVRLMPSDSHIIAVPIGEARRCKEISDRLLDEFGVYIQPINYPTVPTGAERLRITPGPLHTTAQISRLAEAVAAVLA